MEEKESVLNPFDKTFLKQKTSYLHLNDNRWKYFEAYFIKV